MNRKLAAPLIGGVALSLSGCFNASFDWSSLCVGGIGCVGSAPITLSSMTPASPSNSSFTPTLRGNVSFADAVTVSLYGDPVCSSLLAGPATPAVFAASGLSVTLGANTTQSLYAQATDGTTLSSCVYLGDYTHDSIAPSVTLAALPNPINLANVTSVTLSGTCENGLPVSIGGSLATTLSCSGGSFSSTVDFSALAEGPVSVQASQTDGAGNTGNSAAQGATKDAIAPNLTLTAPPTYVNLANYTSFPLGGTCESGINVIVSGSTAGSFPCSANSWSGNVSFGGVGDGAVSLTVTQTDGAGNPTVINAPAPTSKDTGSPTISITTAPAWINLSNQAAYPLSGACSEVGQTLTVKDNGVVVGTTSCAGGSTWSTSVNLTAAAENTRTISVELTDLAGNPNVASVARDKDVTAPTGYATSGVVDGGWVSSDPVSVIITGAPVDANGFDHFNDRNCTSFVGSAANTPSFPWNLNLDASSDLSFRFNDAAGNSSTCYTVGTLNHTSVVRGPKYAVNGSKWNDMVLVGNNFNPPYSQPDSACPLASPSAGGFSHCVNGGEISAVTVQNCAADCSTLGASQDVLGAFDWVCNAAAAPNISFYSTGLKPGKRLADLLDLAVPEFKPNMRFVVSGCTMGAGVRLSEPMKWWTNPVLAPPNNASGGPFDLNVASQINVISSSRASNGYFLSGHGASFVVAPGATLTLGDLAGNNCSSTTGGGGGTARCLLSVPSANAVWIEGNFDAQGTSMRAHSGIFVKGSGYARLRKVGVANSATFAGVSIDGAHNSRVEEALATNSQSYGIGVDSSQYIEVLQVRAMNNASTGISFYNATNFVTQGLIASGNGGYGIAVTNGDSAVLSELTSVNNAGSGIALDGTIDSILHNWVALNNGSNGLFLNDTSQITVGHGVAGGSTYGVSSSTLGSSNNKFAGVMNVGSNGVQNCIVTGDLGPGFVTNTCGNNGASNASWVNNLGSGTGIFVEQIVSDTRNDSSGLPTSYSGITDWLDFDTATRGWGTLGSFMTAGARGNCNAGTCAIWDFGLSSADLRLRNTTGDGTSQNSALTPGAACPPVVNGSVVSIEQASPNRMYLINALEAMRVGGGNQDGICQTNETCIYTPNFGAYQGHLNIGEVPGGCNFANGPVSNVKVLGFLNNGY